MTLETSLFTAQSVDNQAGDLTAQGANGGPVFLSTQPFSPGINTGAAFTPNAFTLYTNWANASGSNAAAQQSVSRGEVLFNTLPMMISVVAGFNDVRGQPMVAGTCTTCHNTPERGRRLVARDDEHRDRLSHSQPAVLTASCNDGTRL